MLDRISIKTSETSYFIEWDKKPLMRISKEVLSNFLSDVIVHDEFLNKELNKNFQNISSDISAIHGKAETYANSYVGYMRKFYKNSNFKPITKTSKDFKYFVELVTVLDNLNLDFKKYLQLQLQRLKFIGEKKFPTPSQLVSNNAIIYIHENDAKVNDRIELTEADKTTPLKENPKYVKLYSKFRNETASLAELEYVKECQKIRTGKVDPKISDTIKRKKILG